LVAYAALNVAEPICLCSVRHCFSAAERADELVAMAIAGTAKATAAVIQRILRIRPSCVLVSGQRRADKAKVRA
jgi:predicted NBD/HSP70 family sugar kinase